MPDAPLSVHPAFGSELAPRRLPLCPELSLWLLGDDVDLSRRVRELFEIDCAPYRAFCWGSGQALARYVLDHPALVRGRRVVDFGAGCAVAAIAALRAGAAQATAVDDPFPATRIRLGRKRGIVGIAARPAGAHCRSMASKAKRVVVLMYPGVQALDAVGPLEVLHTASRIIKLSGKPAPYRIELVAPTAGAQLSRSGYALVAERALHTLKGPIDTLIVAGGESARRIRYDKKLQAWLKQIAPRVRRLCAVCTGSLILAEAGLLDGKRATTHWASCAHMQERYPKVRVEPDPIYVQDGSIYTSAGVTSGIDLTLALVESDLGAEVARTVARWLVVFLQRPGGQAQFSAQLATQAPASGGFKELQAFIVEHPDRDLSVAALAARVAMSPRNFARRFREELGTSPAKYVRSVRVESARRRLERPGESVERVAERCGFGTEETMRRSFQELVSVAPRSYRQRFARAAVSKKS